MKIRHLLYVLLFTLTAFAARADLWSQASGEADGWKNLPWFGWFWSPNTGPGWFYHEQLGWMYTPSETTDSLYLFMSGPGWSWTSSTTFPWIYFVDGWPVEGVWKFYEFGSSNPTWFYSQTTGAWSSGPFDFFTVTDYSQMTFEEIQLPAIGAMERLYGSEDYNLDSDYYLYGGASSFPVPGEENVGYQIASITVDIDTQISAVIEVPEFLIGQEIDILCYGGNDEQDSFFVITKDGDTLVVSNQNTTLPDMPAYATLVADSPSIDVNLYSGGINGRGIFSFNVALRFTPPGEDPVVYGLPEGHFTSIELASNQLGPTPTPTGDVIADSGFRPNPNGFGFQNFGGMEETLDARDVYMIMGINYAYEQDGSFHFTPMGCVWALDKEAGMVDGHCFGMSTATTRFFFRLPLFGKIFPSDYQPGATEPLEVQFTYVEDMVSFWMATQDNPKVQAALEKNFGLSFSDLIDNLYIQLNSGTPIANICMMSNDGSGGHAISPYAITDEGDGIYYIWVYDNNFPSYETNYLYVDTVGGTWSYKSLNPNDVWYENDYSGTEADENLGYCTVADIEDSIAHYPVSDPGETPPTPPTGMVITPQNGTALASMGSYEIGYDFETKEVVRDWPGATIRHIFDHNYSPTLVLPEPVEPLPSELAIAYAESVTITLGPDDAEEEDPTETFDVGMGLQGSDYYNMIEEVELDIGETVEITAHPSGELFGIELIESGLSMQPTFYMAVQDPDTRAGVVYRVKPVYTMTAGASSASLFLTLDPDTYALSAYSFVDGEFQSISSDQFTIEEMECPPYVPEQ